MNEDKPVVLILGAGSMGTRVAAALAAEKITAVCMEKPPKEYRDRIREIREMPPLEREAHLNGVWEVEKRSRGKGKKPKPWEHGF